MNNKRKINNSYGILLTILLLISSCTIVRKYEPGQPFLYKTTIELNDADSLSKQEKATIKSALQDQLADSLQDKTADKLFWQTLKEPFRFDSSHISTSILFIRNYMHAVGYFNDSISYTTDTIKQGIIRKIFKGKNDPQVRMGVNFIVTPGKLVTLDSINYNMVREDFTRLNNLNLKKSYLKKGDAFAKSPISAELDRITDIFRNNGYLRFSRDELVGIWDTVDVALLQPIMDPFEQLIALQQLQERRLNPTANLDIRLRNADSAKFVKYYIGHTTVYPDYSIDTSGLEKKVFKQGDVTVIQYGNTFKPHIFAPNIYLPKDTMYSQWRYNRTVNRFNALGSWRVVSMEQIPRPGQDTVDFVLHLTPAQKYGFNTNLETSINQTAISGNLFGIGANIGINNRNFGRAANQTTSNLRYGIELGNGSFNNNGIGSFIQTQQFSFSHNIYFPRAIPETKLLPDNLRDKFRTLFSFNIANTERRLLYNLTTINGAWGYEYQNAQSWLGKYTNFTVKIPNIEYSNLIKRDSLEKMIIQNPSIQNLFTDGFVISVIGNLTKSYIREKSKTTYRANFEESGLLTGLIQSSFLNKQLYRFIKIDGEIAHLIQFNKKSLALRLFGGVGYAFNSKDNPEKQNSLPFFKQYFSGGPNSMRAWALRRLGPGSTIKEYRGAYSTPDRYGDVQIEANAEYRFPLGKPFGIDVNGALFTDIGNIWYLKRGAGEAEETFRLNRFYNDIAIGAGGGLRIDFSFFVIRLDYAYKVKDPSPSPANAAYQNKFFAYPFFKGAQFQLGIGYPFIF